MTVIRVLALPVVAALAALTLTAAAPTSGHGAMIARDHARAPATGSGAGTARRCTYNYDWNVLYTGGPQYARANWDVSCGLGMQVEAICYNAQTNTSYGKKSGIVYALGLWDQATCLQGDPIQSGWIRFDSGGTLGSWHRFWLR